MGAAVGGRLVGLLVPGLMCVPSPHSGLTHEAHRKEVEQVYLRCAAGTVQWLYPTGALIVNLRPNTFSPARNLTLCIKPLQDASGANIYLEKTGELTLLVQDGDPGPGRVQCFDFQQGGLFVEASPQQDISRRATGFQYELVARHAGPELRTRPGEWRWVSWVPLPSQASGSTETLRPLVPQEPSGQVSPWDSCEVGDVRQTAPAPDLLVG